MINLDLNLFYVVSKEYETFKDWIADIYLLFLSRVNNFRTLRKKKKNWSLPYSTTTGHKSSNQVIYFLKMIFPKNPIQSNFSLDNEFGLQFNMIGDDNLKFLATTCSAHPFSRSKLTNRTY